MTKAAAGWYSVSDGNERYWDGEAWTSQIRPPEPPPAPVATAAAPAVAIATEAPKKKRRIFLWVFLAIQVLFLVWIIGGGMSAHNSGGKDCGSLDADTCQAAADVGAGIGVVLIIGLWVVVDFLLGVGYAIYRLARRP